jgi:hypothetical protein
MYLKFTDFLSNFTVTKKYSMKLLPAFLPFPVREDNRLTKV